jgi:hypothetical protein
MERNAIGVDRNPLAYVLSKAKAERPDLSDVMDRLDALESGYRDDSVSFDDMPGILAPFFHPWVFAQLIYLRRQLDAQAVDMFIRALIVGILHGQSRKSSVGSLYLSVDMPNTFSMSPGYVAGYVERHNLRRPPYDVFASCRRRAKSLLTPTAPVLRGTVYLGDATQVSHVVEKGSVDLIITSPPYLGLLRYGAFNWLRLWFLGEEANDVDRMLDTTSSVERYENFMLSFLCDLALVAKPRSRAVLFVGELRRRRVRSLAQTLLRNVVPLTPWRTIALSSDVSTEDSKTTRIWGEGKRGDASNRDEVLVLQL